MNLKRRQIPSYDQIIDNIYLGNFGSALSLEELKFIGIRKVICCALAMPLPFQDEMIYKHLPIIDDPEEDILPYLTDGIKFLNDCDSSVNVLVHCQAGVSRSASIVIGFIMWKMRLSYEEAFLLVKQKRKCVCPNDGFIIQLKNFEESLIINNYNIF